SAHVIHGRRLVGTEQHTRHFRRFHGLPPCEWLYYTPICSPTAPELRFQDEKKSQSAMNTNVTHLESALDGTRLDARRVQTLHQGRPWGVRYDLAAVRRAVTPADIASRPPSLWRYRELLPLPLDEEPVTLGEGMPPLLPCSRLGRDFGLSRLLVKDE